MQKQVNTAQKLELLKSIISGGLSFASLRPPETFVIFKKQDLYTVGDGELNEDQFQAWKEATLREIDNVVIFDHQSDIWDNEPELSHIELLAQYEALKPVAYKHITTEIEPVETPVSSLETEPVEEEEETQLFAIPVKKTSGLMSQYGITWGIKEN